MCVADTKLKYTAAHIKAASITASTVLKLNFMWPPTSRVLLYYFFLKKPSNLAWMALLKSGCGKFQPINAPITNQNNVSNMTCSFLPKAIYDSSFFNPYPITVPAIAKNNKIPSQNKISVMTILLLSTIHCCFGIGIYHCPSLIHWHAGLGFGVALKTNHTRIWF